MKFEDVIESLGWPEPLTTSTHMYGVSAVWADGRTLDCMSDIEVDLVQVGDDLMMVPVGDPDDYWYRDVVSANAVVRIQNTELEFVYDTEEGFTILGPDSRLIFSSRDDKGEWWKPMAEYLFGELPKIDFSQI